MHSRSGARMRVHIPMTHTRTTHEGEEDWGGMRVSAGHRKIKRCEEAHSLGTEHAVHHAKGHPEHQVRHRLEPFTLKPCQLNMNDDIIYPPRRVLCFLPKVIQLTLSENPFVPGPRRVEHLTYQETCVCVCVCARARYGACARANVSS